MLFKLYSMPFNGHNLQFKYSPRLGLHQKFLVPCWFIIVYFKIQNAVDDISKINVFNTFLAIWTNFEQYDL